MELLQLKYFEKVAKLQHMTKAADELHISQSSLSRTISRLEEDIGAKLFEREGRQIKLNNYGEMFLKRVENTFRELEEGKREIEELKGIEKKTVVVGATITRLLPNVFREFLDIYPDVKFQLYQLTSKEVESQLEEGKVDFSITTPMIQKKGIISVPLKKEKFFLAVGPRHRLASKKIINLNELLEEPFISLSTDYSFQQSINSLCEKNGFTPNVMFESNDTEVIFKLVLEGFGVAFMPAHWWDEDRKTLPAKLEIENSFSQRIIGLSWKDDHYLSKTAKDFREFAINYFKEEK